MDNTGIKVEKLNREFHFKDQKLPDPNPQMSEADAIDFYSNTYSELTNGFVEEIFVEDGKLIVKVKTAVGVKG